MPVVDTDFLVALFREDDGLGEHAEELYREHEGNLVAPPYVLLELLFVSIDYSMDPERVVANALELVECSHDEGLLLKAAHFVKEMEMTPLDAVVAAFSDGRRVISSDSALDRAGVERIELKRRG
ncbi:MAG: hypothetical protein MAG715_00779 [Methanonatronarchaeales archaeon]|nr:hypothetical protein [Methanonatronarchaeales archaeon]